jgi:AmiR/NasT family two-component response regulator
LAQRADEPQDERRTFGDLSDAQRRIDNLEVALQTNRRIGVAIGILMSRHGADEDTAFTMLARASQAANRKLRDVAEAVVYEGDLPRRLVESDGNGTDVGAVR